ncbi:MAG: hypothetical protein K6F53_01560 [Lachnospiraceae bacterium]|nr:hypothetical protein [Lachnospiraceae bacterium]
MTVEDFAEKLIGIAADMSREDTGAADPKRKQPFSEERAEAFIRELGSMYSEREMRSEFSRKQAARILHVFFLKVLDWQDEDWGECSSLRDIYDCRICANAIAQVCVKGIMHPVKRTEFGIAPILSGEEAEEIFRRIREI